MASRRGGERAGSRGRFRSDPPMTLKRGVARAGRVSHAFPVSSTNDVEARAGSGGRFRAPPPMTLKRGGASEGRAQTGVSGARAGRARGPRLGPLTSSSGAGGGPRRGVPTPLRGVGERRSAPRPAPPCARARGSCPRVGSSVCPGTPRRRLGGPRRTRALGGGSGPRHPRSRSGRRLLPLTPGGRRGALEATYREAKLRPARSSRLLGRGSEINKQKLTSNRPANSMEEKERCDPFGSVLVLFLPH